MIAFADSSFLFSVYVQDANSSLAATRLTHVKLPLLLTDLIELEITNGVALRLFRKELQPAQAKEVLELLRRDEDSGTLRILPLPSSAYQRARQIATNHTPALGTRTLDVLHVASALVLNVDTFCTFDQKQGRLASRLGMRIL